MSKLASARRQVLAKARPVLGAIRADRRAREFRQRVTAWEMRAKALRTDPNDLLDQIVATATETTATNAGGSTNENVADTDRQSDGPNSACTGDSTSRNVGDSKLQTGAFGTDDFAATNFSSWDRQ